MMRKIILVVIMALPELAFCQRVIGNISLQNKVTSVQAIPFGDSLYLKYGENIEGIPQEKALWISLSGKKIHTYHAWNIFEIESFNDTLYYYYIEPTTNLLRAYTLINGNPVRQKEKLEFSGQLVGTYKEDGLNFITIDRKAKKLKLFTINKLQLRAAQEFELPEALADEIRGNFMVEFYNGDNPINSFQGVSKLKLYKYGHFLYLTSDKYVSNSKTNGVKAFEINLENKTTNTFEIAHLQQRSFRSFLINGRVYKYFNYGKAAQLNEYRFDGSESGKTITYKDSIADFPIYYRHGSAKITSRDEMFSNLLGKSWAATSELLNIFSADSGRVVIQCGSFYNDKGVGVPSAASPIAALLTFAVSTTLKQVFLENPGAKKYYYYEKQVDEDRFKLAPNSRHIRQTIDDYEIEQTPILGKQNYRGYYELDTGIIAIYQYRKDKALRLVFFPYKSNDNLHEG